jgi:hypothetical protein
LPSYTLNPIKSCLFSLSADGQTLANGETIRKGDFGSEVFEGKAVFLSPGGIRTKNIIDVRTDSTRTIKA